jgi:hypothetical protein
VPTLVEENVDTSGSSLGAKSNSDVQSFFGASRDVFEGRLHVQTSLQSLALLHKVVQVFHQRNLLCVNFLTLYALFSLFVRITFVMADLSLPICGMSYTKQDSEKLVSFVIGYMAF